MSRRTKGEGGIYQSSDGGWRAYVTLPDGRRKYVRAKTKAEANQKRRDLLVRRDTVGISTSTETVGAWISHWIDMTAERHKPSTTHGYRYSVQRYLSPEFKNVKLDKLKIEHVEQEYQRLLETGLSGSTRHQCHSIIRAALKSAVQRGHIGFNPADLVENKPKIDRRQTQALSEADIRQIEKALAGTRSEARWMLALALGLRPSEVCGLEWKHLDWDNALLTVGQQVQQLGKQLVLVKGTKTDAGERIIRVPSFLMDLLRQHRLNWLQENTGVEMWSPDGEPHSWMFTRYRTPGMPLDRNSDATSWRRILEQAGLPHVRMYAARHSAATMLIAHGVDAHTVADILGHRDAVFTQRVYVHALAERKQQAADVLDEIYRR